MGSQFLPQQNLRSGEVRRMTSPSTERDQSTTTTKPRLLKGHKAAATCCIASLSNPGIVATSGEDGCICWFDLRCKDVLFTIDVGEDPVSSICFRTGNEEIIYASAGDEVKSFDIRLASSPKQLESYNYNKEEINQITFSPKSSFLAAADDSGDVKIIDTRQQCLYKTLRAVHTSICSSVQFLSWKPWSVITGGLDSKVAMWDFSKGHLSSLIDYGVPDLNNSKACGNPGQSFNPAFVHCIAVPEVDTLLGLNNVCAVARGDGVVDVMDIESEMASVKSNSSMRPRRGSQPRSKGTVKPNENDGTTSQRKRLQLDYTLGGHSAAVSCVSFSLFGERGRFLISGGNDASVKVWDWSKLFDAEEQSCDNAIHLSIAMRKNVNWLCTTSNDSENLIVCDTSKVVKIYTVA